MTATTEPAGGRSLAPAAALLALTLSAFSCATPMTRAWSAYEDHRYTEAVLRWDRLADKGEAEAQFMLGLIFDEGRDGVSPDASRAAKHYHGAAAQGHVPAMNNLARLYFEGRGVPRSLSRARRWFRRASHAGFEIATTNLGFLTLLEDRDTADPADAIALLEQAAQQGNLLAPWILGAAHAEGLSVPQDPREAARWFRVAASQGHPQAQYMLGMAYLDGNGIRRDRKAAEHWLGLSADNGFATAQTALALLMADRPDEQDRVRTLLERAADQDEPVALYNLAILELRDNDLEAAWNCLSTAADRGFLPARTRAALLLATGRGVSADRVTAYAWLASAAERGDPDAGAHLDLLAEQMPARELELGRQQAAAGDRPAGPSL